MASVGKKVWDNVKVTRKGFFNPRLWLGYDALKDQTVYLYDFFKTIFIPAAPEREETFAEAIKRLNLTASDVETTSQNYLLYSLGFLLLAVLAFIFGFYLLILHLAIAGWILSLATTALFLVQAFRFNFWHFQMKHRKLGCTFEEWKRGKPYDDREHKA